MGCLLSIIHCPTDHPITARKVAVVALSIYCIIVAIRPRDVPGWITGAECLGRHQAAVGITCGLWITGMLGAYFFAKIVHIIRGALCGWPCCTSACCPSCCKRAHDGVVALSSGDRKGVVVDETEIPLVSEDLRANEPVPSGCKVTIKDRADAVLCCAVAAAVTLSVITFAQPFGRGVCHQDCFPAFYSNPDHKGFVEVQITAVANCANDNVSTADEHGCVVSEWKDNTYYLYAPLDVTCPSFIDCGSGVTVHACLPYEGKTNSSSTRNSFATAPSPSPAVINQQLARIELAVLVSVAALIALLFIWDLAPRATYTKRRD